MSEIKTPIALIVAVARNGVIGRDNKMPWHLPGELKYFKATTMGKPIVMGRKTFESLGRPLPGRTNIVITRDRSFAGDGIVVVHDVDEALQRADAIAQRDSAAEIMVIGGADIYRQTLPRATVLYITEVHAEVEGDAFFPPFERGQWARVSSEDVDAQAAKSFAYTLAVYRRRADSNQAAATDSN